MKILKAFAWLAGCPLAIVLVFRLVNFAATGDWAMPPGVASSAMAAAFVFGGSVGAVGAAHSAGVPL